MKKVSIFLALFLSLSVTFGLESCPSGVTNDPYPGQCGQYIDENGNSFCDLGETGSIGGSGSHEGQDACDSNLATGELTSTQMKAMTVEQLAKAFNVDLTKAIEEISTRAGFTVEATTSVQDIHDRASLPMKEMRTLLEGITGSGQSIQTSTENTTQPEQTSKSPIFSTLQSMYVGIFIVFIIILIVLFLTRNIQNRLTRKIKTIDANIRLLYIPIIGFSQSFLFPTALPVAIHRGYLGFRTLRLLLIARPIANILMRFSPTNSITKFFTWIVSKRKQLGIAMFWFAAIHGITRNITWLGLGMTKDMLLSLMGIFGLVALLATGVAFVTSNKKAMIYFGRNWKKIQQITYAALTLTVVHIYFVNDDRGMIVIGLFIVRAILRTTARRLKKNSSK